MRVPRAYVVVARIYGSGPGEHLDRMASDSSIRCEHVVLDAPIQLAHESHLGGEAAFRTLRNNRMYVMRSLSEPGVLVLTDSFLSGMESFRRW